MLRKKKSFYSYGLTVPALALYAIFFLLPAVIGLVMAFTDWNIKTISTFSFNGLENFIALFKDKYFRLATFNTLWFALVTTVLKVAFGLGLAMLLVRPLFGRNLFRTVFYLPAVLSAVVIGLIFTSVYQMGGLFDQILALFGFDNQTIIWLGDASTAMWCIIATEVWQWSGFNMIIFITGLQGIPNDYYEAAAIDGASPWKRFTHITFPLLAPSFTIAATTSLIGGLKVFAQVYVLTNGGPGFATQVLSTYVYKAFSSGLLGRSSAMSLVLTLIVTVFSLLLNKYLKGREVEV